MVQAANCPGSSEELIALNSVDGYGSTEDAAKSDAYAVGQAYCQAHRQNACSNYTCAEGMTCGTEANFTSPGVGGWSTFAMKGGVHVNFKFNSGQIRCTCQCEPQKRK